MFTRNNMINSQVTPAGVPSRVLLKIISEVSRVMITVIYLIQTAAAVTAGGVDKWIRLGT